MRIKNSFKLKLIFSYLFLILISFGFIAFFLDKNLEHNVLSDIQASLVTQAQLIESQLAAGSIPRGETIYLENLAQDLGRRGNFRVTIIDNKGKVLADSEKKLEQVPDMENHSTRPEVRAALLGKTGINSHYSFTLKKDMLYVALPIRDQDKIVGALRLSLPLTRVEEMLLETRKTVAAGVFLALCAAFILGSILAAQTIKPINRMIQVSRKFSEGDFSRRVIVGSQDEIGELAGTLNKMAQDIQDKIKEANTRNQQLVAVFNSMVEGVMVVGRNGHIISVNPAIEKAFGLSVSEVVGRMVLEAIRNNDIAEIIREVLEKGKPLSREINLFLPVRKVFQVNATPVFDDEQGQGAMVVMHDITNLRRLEIMRSDFVANVSHELKTPLTSIKGFIETLLGGAIEDKEHNRNFLKIIQDHAQRLQSLVEDLLSLAHLESREIVFEKNEFGLRAQVEEVLAGFRSQLRNKSLETRNAIPDGLWVSGDKGRLTQVFTNLIDNAIKFNKNNGFVEISSQDLGDQIKIAVVDSGIGIPEKDIPRIFERFYRVDKARSRELGGTGLGLSIVKHIIERHQGQVGVESTEGLGSKFWFTFPKA